MSGRKPTSPNHYIPNLTLAFHYLYKDVLLTLSSSQRCIAETMVKAVVAFLLFFVFFFISDAEHIVAEPKLNRSFEIQTPKNIPNACSYRVTIKTSCSSTSYTRDRISLVFGDIHLNEVYAGRLDDPSSRTFERCSTDTFQITGPCIDRICYMYLLRIGSDGWKPEDVKIYSPNYGSVSFKFNSWVPNGVWFGFDFCDRGSIVASA